MTGDQVARELERIGQDLAMNIDEVLMMAAEIVINDIKNDSNLNSDGPLKNSIEAVVQDGYFGIKLNEYGLYQNYGVAGSVSKDKARFAIPAVILDNPDTAPRNGSEYAFTSPIISGYGNDLPYGARINIARYGIEGNNFLRLDERIEKIVEIINQELEL